MSNVSISLDQTLNTEELNMIQKVRPCFCFNMHFLTFFKLFNFINILVALVLLIISSIFLFLGSNVYIFTSFIIIFFVFFMISLFGLIFYVKFRRFTSLYHRRQSVFYLITAIIILIIFLCIFCVLGVSSLTIIKWQSLELFLNDNLISIYIMFPFFLFNLYWSYIYVKMVFIQVQLDSIEFNS